MSPVRQAALRALLRIDDGRATLPAAVDHERARLADARDRALLLELVSGTLRWRNALDAELAALSRRPMGELDPPVRAILRLSVYQLRHLDRVPAHAVVDDAVELARAATRGRAAGFVNAVLRGALRRPSRGVLPASPGPDGARVEQVRYLSITLSHPEWLVSRWLDRLGFVAAEAWCRYNNEPPGLAVRAHAGSEAGLAQLMDDPASGVVRSPVLESVGRIASGGLGRLPEQLRDRVTVQDEGSLLVGLAVPVPPAGRVLDVCAAPGNKTIAIAERAGPAVLVVASDYRRSRVARLSASLRARRLPVPVVRLNAEASLPFRPVFDTVLLDAPCSGLGTLRREPDLKWSRQPGDLPRLAAAERRMLSEAARVVAPGGCVVYATCSSEPDENDDVVAAFLADHPSFERQPVVLSAPVRSTPPFVEADGVLRTRPDRDQLDAFFAAVLVRRRAA